MSEDVRQTVGDEWTPEAIERLSALTTVKDPWWYRPLMRILWLIPGTRGICRRLDRYQVDRAVAIHRGRYGGC